ncbi:MarR family winged helix-turn-helix transcriptional regulator [Solilutibacter tolerans]|uniref:Transcriptional regulator, MarR family n=1 Tax=Solilutibacter tolerans TaxID=1604334 RepID=A0A1N6T8B6_9GAMM|nr:MarR family transcriptional regulator [Lysobacter tolerans]SIQ49635.1 transcriptional regulator, MarR family [Lysobacter tolerans]
MNTKSCAAPQQDEAASFGILLRQVRDLSRTALEAELAAAGHDLSFSQYITLKKVAMGCVSPGELARAAELNPGAMTRVLDQLEAKGLLRRTADPDDRRALRIELDASGEALIPTIRSCGARVLARAQQGMSPAEQAEFQRMLELIRDNLLDARQG